MALACLLTFSCGWKGGWGFLCMGLGGVKCTYLTVDPMSMPEALKVWVGMEE